MKQARTSRSSKARGRARAKARRRWSHAVKTTPTNRAGKKLPASRRRVLGRSKRVLQERHRKGAAT